MHDTNDMNDENDANDANDENDANDANDVQDLNDLNNEETQRKVLEHENLLNRLVIFEEKKKIHNLKFLEDIQQRKKEEKNKR